MPASDDVQSLFKKHFGFPPAHVVRVPATLELLGSSAVLPDGLVISAALNRYVHMASAPRTDGRIELVSSTFPRPERFWVTEVKRNAAAPWADFPKGVLHELARRGVHFSGFSALLHDEIPAGGALGRMAAIEVATGLTVRRLFPFSLSETGLNPAPRRDSQGTLPSMSNLEKRSLAELCRDAETRFLNIDVPSSAQLSCLVARAWHVMSIVLTERCHSGPPVPCDAGTVDHLPLIGEALVVCLPSRMPASLQNNWRPMAALCDSAARKLGARTLRQVTARELASRKRELEVPEYNCAAHVVAELARVVAAERALRVEDHAQFGSYLFQSDESARSLPGRSTPEVELLVKCCLAQEGCAGVRAQGNGVVAMVAHHQAQGFVQIVSLEYQRQTASTLHYFVCQTADGAE